LHPTPQIIGYVIAGVVILAVLAFRLRNLSRTRPLRVPTLLIAPVYLAAVSAFLIWRFPIAGMDWVWMTVIFVLGAALGWYRGKMMHITVDPDTQSLLVKTSPMALIFLVGLIVVRMALREVFMENAAAWHVSFNLLTDGFVAFAFGLLAVNSLEMYLRAKRLLDEAKGGGAIAA
jgi:membrane protein CcdC involved in cytochrome C biogenesis